jgi:demethylmenaquinone methyltransferase / 2-methoxy-6-polyprenyl-1,4-benzoquinol methylase
VAEADHGIGGRNEVARRLFAGLPERYDALAELLSFGQNRRWRVAMVDHVVAAHPGVVLDVATGTAGVAIMLAEKTSASITGIDLSDQMLAQGKRALADHGLTGRITLHRGRAEDLPFADASFDALTFTYLLRYVEDPAATVAELARVVRPGGVMASLEFFVPPRRVWRGLWWLYTRLGLPVAGLAGGRAWFEVGRFLGPSISEHYRLHPLPSIIAAWQAAGMTDVHHSIHCLGGGLVMWGRRAGG